ncbi:unnamed protein product [Clonostachys rosea]|uniref:Uncharacterized protein n=1 Tax=Bionectria ochroleuca TaxID=29856 RepID=A0ABY6TU38_BIOOC|nr:unnamed protein product [Clonostachys rosea]
MRSRFALLSLSILFSSVADYAQAAKVCKPCRGPCAAAVRPSLNQNHDTEADCVAFLSGAGYYAVVRIIYAVRIDYTIRIDYAIRIYFCIYYAVSTSTPQSTSTPESTTHTVPESTTSSTLVALPTVYPRLLGTDVSGGASYQLKLISSGTQFFLSYSATLTQYAPANGAPYNLDPVTGRLSITLSPGLDGTTTQTYYLTYNTPLPKGSGYVATWMTASAIAATTSKRYVRCTRADASGLLNCVSEAAETLLILHTTNPTVYIGLPPAAGNSIAMTLSLPFV